MVCLLWCVQRTCYRPFFYWYWSEFHRYFHLSGSLVRSMFRRLFSRMCHCCIAWFDNGMWKLCLNSWIDKKSCTDMSSFFAYENKMENSFCRQELFHLSFQKRVVSPEPICTNVIALNRGVSLKMSFYQKEPFSLCGGYGRVRVVFIPYQVYPRQVFFVVKLV